MKRLSEQEIKSMSDNELREQVKLLEFRADDLRKRREDPQRIETEICYVQREIELRRKFGHAQQTARVTESHEGALSFDNL
jgi:hypothetical protein